VSFTGISLSSFVEPVKLGISLGLFAGNQLGVFIMLVLGIKFGLSAMPRDTN
jgi:NhaA family Na+:H+ antiporter